MRQGTYAEYQPPRTPWQWVWMTCSQWRTRFTQWRQRPDGRDYTGWTARVVELPDSVAGGDLGAEGTITRCQGEGSRRLHYIELPGQTWVLPLPSRCVELTPPDCAGDG